MKGKKTVRAKDPTPTPAEWSGGADALSEAAAALAWAAPVEAAPSPQVRARLLARVRADKATASPAPVRPGWRFASAQTAEGWRETFPGVRFKTLSVDDERDVVMLLVEMKPGARFPDHPHDDAGDEGLVISGDLVMDGHMMRAGDYYHADRGTDHVNIVSPSGCTAMLSLRASVWRKWRQTMVAR